MLSFIDRCRVTSALGLGLMLLLFVVAAPAQASQLTRAGDTYQYRDAAEANPTSAAETNDLLVTKSTGFITFEDNVTINAATAPGCTPQAGTTVTCPDTAVTEIEVFLGGNSDTLLFNGNFGAIFATASGGAANDTLTGTGSNDTLSGDAGDDALRGFAGNDTYRGGAGQDDMGDTTPGSNFADGADDRVDYTGQAGNITASIGTQANGSTCPGPECLDRIRESVENITGSGGNDLLIGSAAPNDLDGAGGSDTLNGLAGNDGIVGGSGTDTATYENRDQSFVVNLNTQGAPQTVNGTEADTLSGIENATGGVGDDQLIGDAENNVLKGGGGNDDLEGNDGDDDLDGQAGDDTLQGFADADVIRGGAGVDRVLYDDKSGAPGNATNISVTTFDNAANDGVSNSSEGDNVQSDVERIRGGNGNDTLTGAPTVNNEFDGGTGGADRVTYADHGASDPVVADLIAGGGGVSDDDTYLSVENLTGSAGDDVLFGTPASNSISGVAGNDRIDGRAGPDTLIGGAGVDTVDYSAPDRTPGVTVTLTTGSDDGNVDDGAITRDDLSEIENVIGTNGDDGITGNQSANTLDGRGGDDDLNGLTEADTLRGATGVDELFGEQGNDVLDPGSDGGGADNSGAPGDTIEGGAGTDVVTYASRTSGVSVTLDNTANDGAPGEEDLVDGIENAQGGAGADTLTGNDDPNGLEGGAGADTLTGNGGNDAIDGGTGADTSSGGEGDDTFALRDAIRDGVTSCGNGADTVTADFDDPVTPDCETVDRSADPSTGGNTNGGNGNTGGTNTGGGTTTNPPANPPANPPTTNPTPPPNRNPLDGPRQMPRSVTAVIGPRRDRRAPYRYLVSGQVDLPAAFAPFRTQVCAEGGIVSVQTKRGSRTLSTRRVRIDDQCSFDVTVTFRSKRVVKGARRSSRLKFTARFLGNRYLRPQAASPVFGTAG